MMWWFAVLWLVAVAGQELSPTQLAELRAIQEGKVAKSQIEVVLSQYDEDVAWSDDYKNIRTVYCKKSSVGAEGCIPLENVGREGHTYLHHIVKNYDNLAEWTVFSQAGAPTVGYKGHRLGGGHMMPGMSFHDYVLQRDQPDGGLFVFTARVHVPTLAHSLRNNYVSAAKSDLSALTCPKEGSGDSWEPWWDMGWFKEFLGSRCGVSASQMGETFADFWDQHIKSPRPESDVVFFTQGARFAASKARIQQRPKAFYEDLLRLVSWEQDPCANYFNEWSWHYIIGNPQKAPCSMTEAERPPAHAAPRTLLAEIPMSSPVSGGCPAAESAPAGPCTGVVSSPIPSGATQFTVLVPSGCTVGGEIVVCNQIVTLTEAVRRLDDDLKNGRRLTSVNKTVNANPPIVGALPAGAPLGPAPSPSTTTTTEISFGLPWWFWLLMYCLCCLCLAMCGVIPLPFMTGKKKPTAKPAATPSIIEEVITVEDEEPLVPMATAMVPMASMAVPAGYY